MMPGMLGVMVMDTIVVGTIMASKVPIVDTVTGCGITNEYGTNEILQLVIEHRCKFQKAINFGTD